MKSILRIAVFFSILFTGLGINQLLAQDSATVQDSTLVLPDGVGEIKLTTSSDTDEVPRNRTVTYTATLTWTGNLAAYKILEIKDPQVENFKILKNSATHRTEIKNGQPVAVKILEYVLEPQSLGMGYAGDMLIKYQNVLTGEENRLFTNRLGIKVVDPVAEPGSRFLFIPKAWLLPIMGVLVIFVLGYLLFYIWRKRREKKRLEQESLASKRSLEEKFLNLLKEKIDFNSSDLVIQFAEVSRIFRHYLSEKYQFSALEATTANIIQALSTITDDEKVLENTEEILKTCDLAKFSGGALAPAELSRVFTLLESILEAETKTKPEMQA